MGSGLSQPTESSEPQQAPKMTDAMKKVLDDHTYWPGEDSKFPFYLIQLDEQGELPCGDNDDIFMSDCIWSYLSDNSVTHILIQTHGWNTPRKSCFFELPSY